MEPIKGRKTAFASKPARGWGRRGARYVLAAGIALASTQAFADVIATAQLQGWINSRGGSNEAVPRNNMFTGNENGMRFNSWAAFYIPAGTYTSATLSLNPGYYGNPGLDVIGLFDVSTPLSGFLNTFAPGTDVFNDLGSGRQYAAAKLYNQPLSISLNNRALGDINGSADHWFLIGFTNQTLNAIPATASSDGIYVNGVARNTPVMELLLGTPASHDTDPTPLPEPSTLMSVGLGLGTLACLLRRRERRG